jgi:sulfatase maturation enzyme AslB (radical SAM superfamily)
MVSSSPIWSFCVTPIDPKKDFFCTAPWRSLYQHDNNTTPCHAIRNGFGSSPKEYFKSDLLRSIKEDFVAGRVPDTCKICYDREQIGIKSTRLSILRQRNNPDHTFFYKEDFPAEAESKINRIELRSSNLCNFKCRMCDANSSSEIGREQGIEEYIKESNERTIQELKEIALDDMNVLCLTGGEPMLIKHYYDFLDTLIERGLNEKVTVELFTNCSVYNPLFVERLKKFRIVRFVMSIDGVGKTAEYQRKGTDWNVVEQNIYRYAALGEPFKLFFNTAISPYVLLDASSLATFLMKLYSINDKIDTKCYATVRPRPLHFENTDMVTRTRIIEEIDKAAEILTVPNFDIIRKEFLDIKRNLIEKPPVSPKLFIEFTNNLDKIRNEKFEDVFGYKLV